MSASETSARTPTTMRRLTGADLRAEYGRAVRRTEEPSAASPPLRLRGTEKHLSAHAGGRPLRLVAAVAVTAAGSRGPRHRFEHLEAPARPDRHAGQRRLGEV